MLMPDFLEISQTVRILFCISVLSGECDRALSQKQPPAEKAVDRSFFRGLFEKQADSDLNF